MNYTKADRSNIIARYNARPATDDDADTVVKLAKDCDELAEKLSQAEAVVETLKTIVSNQSKNHREFLTYCGPG